MGRTGLQNQRISKKFPAFLRGGPFSAKKFMADLQKQQKYFCIFAKLPQKQRISTTHIEKFRKCINILETWKILCYYEYTKKAAPYFRWGTFLPSFLFLLSFAGLGDFLYLVFSDCFFPWSQLTVSYVHNKGDRAIVPGLLYLWKNYAKGRSPHINKPPYTIRRPQKRGLLIV